MAIQYKWVRMRKVDYEKMVRDKKIPMEQQFKLMTGKKKKLSDVKLMTMGANSTWDFGKDANEKLFKAFTSKKNKLRFKEFY